VLGVARCASSTPVSVMILNVEPGGCSSESGAPAAASSSPVDGAITTIPPVLVPSSATASACSDGEIEVRTSAPARATALASRRPPA